MFDLITRIFYTFLSIAVAVLLAVFLAGTVTAFVTEDKECRTAFTVESVTVEAVSAGDCHIGAQEPSQWKKVTVTALAQAWKYSPYTYQIETFHLAASDTQIPTGDVLVETDAPLSYDRTAPDSFTLTVYLRTGAEGEALYDAVRSLAFCGETVTKSLGALSEPVHLYVPYLSLENAVIDGE